MYFGKYVNFSFVSQHSKLTMAPILLNCAGKEDEDYIK